MRRFIFRLALFLILIGSLFYSTWIDQFAIHKIVVIGSDGDTNTAVEHIADNMIQGSYLAVVPKKNALFYPKKNIGQSILNQFPKIKSVSQSTEGFDLLNIKLTERQPVFRWCQDQVEIESGDPKCFLLDDQAFVYEVDATSTDIQSSDLITLYGGSLSTSTDPLGKIAFDANTYLSIKSGEEDFASSSLPVESVEYSDVDNVKFNIKNNGTVIISMRKPIDESIGNVQSALKSSVFSTSSTFEYVDARFGNKIFYRLKNNPSNSGTLGSSTASTSKSLQKTSVKH